MNAEEIRQFIEQLNAVAASPLIHRARAGAQDLARHEAPPGVQEAAQELDALLADFQDAIEAAITANTALLEVGYPSIPTLTVTPEVKQAITDEVDAQQTSEALFVTAAATGFGNVVVHSPELK